MELDSNIYEKIKNYSAEGEKLFFDGRFHEALREYNKAFDVIPEPKHQWEASVWLIAAMGDCYFWLRDFDTALEYFRNETEPGNKASQRVLEKCGFVPLEISGEEGPRFARIK